jgi:hypothetical protein
MPPSLIISTMRGPHLKINWNNEIEYRKVKDSDGNSNRCAEHEC